MASTIAEERWTSTTIQAAFVLRPLSRIPPKSGGISIDLPLLDLGWTFSLSLKPPWNVKKGDKRRIDQWIPAEFSFKQHGDRIRWGSTSIRAQLSLGGECTPANESTPLSDAMMNVVLADTLSSHLPLVTSCTIPSLQPNKVWLSVTVSDCHLPNGLFDARFSPVNEAQAQAQFFGQSGDRLLSRSLSTGKLFDVKFLTSSACPASGSNGKLLSTYASLSVLEGHIDPSSAIVGERWKSAVAALGNTDIGCVREVSCPDGHDHDLDSDYEDEDEDEASFTPEIAVQSKKATDYEPDQAIPQGGLFTPIPLHALTLEPRTDQQSESGNEMSSDSLSSFELEGATEQGSVDHQPEEVIKDLKGLPSDHERTIRIKFAAHRTWHAFLWYCYTSSLQFDKLKSQVEPGGQHLRVTPLEGGPPACSPKSMYRLAHLVGDKNLKAKALVAIKERTVEANVLDELFSVFTSKYCDIQQVQLDVFMEHRRSPKVKEAFPRAMRMYGSMPHVQPVLSALYDNLVA